MSSFLEVATELRNALGAERVPKSATHLIEFAREKARTISSCSIPSSLESIDDPIFEFSALFLWWFISNQQTNLVNQAEIPVKIGRLLVLCNRHGVFDLGVLIGEQLVNCEATFKSLNSNSPVWQMLLSYAKCLRRQGKYKMAMDLYANLAENIKHNNDLASQAHLLLNMGKTAHNHQWRAGYSRCLTHFALKRFQKLYAQEDEGSNQHRKLARLLAICLDSQAMIDFEVRSRAYESGWNTGLMRQLRLTWKTALRYANQSTNDNTKIRIRCRSAYATFHLTKSYAQRLTSLQDFQCALRHLEDTSIDQRGLAVRFGQYAEMLANFDPVQNEQKIKHYIKLAVRYAERERDWRTLATNQIRLAKIFFDNRYSDSKFSRQQILVALSVLNNLSERLPELEIEANLELARQQRAGGDYQKSHEYLNCAYEIVGSLEERLYNDLEHSFRNNYLKGTHSDYINSSYVPTCLLHPSEMGKAREALFLDFQLHSALLNKVANDRLFTADRAANQAATELQLAFLQDILRGQAHSFKGIIGDFRSTISRVSDRSYNENIKLSSLIFSLNKTAVLIEKKFEELLVPYPSLVTNDVSVRSVILKITDDIRRSNQFESLELEIEELPSSPKKTEDFLISCCRRVLEIAIENLIINAARAATQYSTKIPGRVDIRIKHESSDDGHRYFGAIEIEDSGGKVNRLQSALTKVNSVASGIYGERETFGLPHAITFFGGFNGEFEVKGLEGYKTILKLRLPFSSRVKHD